MHEYLALAAWTVLTVLAVRPRRIVVQPTIGQQNLSSSIFKQEEKKEKGNKTEDRRSSGTDLLGLIIFLATGLFSLAGWAWILQGVAR